METYCENDYSIIVDLFSGQYIFRVNSAEKDNKGQLVSHNFGNLIH